MKTLEKGPSFSPQGFIAPIDQPRRRTELVTWHTRLGDLARWASPGFSHSDWEEVRTPHNWEDYHGYHAVSHGNLHGTAWYRTHFDWQRKGSSDRLYAFFEGVGSYATVFCNGVLVGEHAGGRTTFTVDLTPGLLVGENLLAVRAHHPENIDDLPFVCGGCWGSPHTEGSQPLGLFRPVWLEQAGPVRVEPFGLHILTPQIDRSQASLQVRVEIRNAGPVPLEVDLSTRIFCPNHREVISDKCTEFFAPGECRIVAREFTDLKDPRLWSPETPHLYTAVAEVWVGGEISHTTSSTFGFRWLEWPARSPHFLPRAMPEDLVATRTLLRSPDAPPGLKILEPRITAGSGLPERAELSVDLAFETTTSVPVRLFCEVQDQNGTVFFHQYRTTVELGPATVHRWDVPVIHRPHLWSASDPCLHKLVVELRNLAGEIWERQETHFGIEAIEEDLARAPTTPTTNPRATESGSDAANERRLLVNGKPVFINGTCEYETLLGADHAFTQEQISANVAMMKSAGFNAFRDAHHPHNLRYYDHWDRAGFLCWTQMGSHIWFDSDRFRENFRRSVAEWVRERRNHPCIIMWGIQNESVLPEEFTREIHNLIRELDPTVSTNRLTTTCNGGSGSDWNVPQEWSGTYGGNFNDYNLTPLQLVGEYGAWREFGVHTEREYLGDENDRSESWACQAMATKIRLAEQARDHAVGHFHWVFSSFPNPGRSADNYEGPGNAQIGSINNKGLLTAWHQPSDLYHLFRASYADPTTAPMVYLVSHTWPDRWAVPGPKTIRVFSNCDFVELFNGEEENTLGIRKNPGRGRHFIWNHIELKTNVLCAVGWKDGKRAARDLILLDHLPDDGLLSRWAKKHTLQTLPGCTHRISCGDQSGFVDRSGNLWTGDLAARANGNWLWESWAGGYQNVPAELASCGYTMSPVAATPVPELYRTYRFGRSKLKYLFNLPKGSYELKLHFVEPWFGVGGGLDCTRWRLFHVAINENVVLRNLDILRWTPEFGPAGKLEKAMARGEWKPTT